MKHFFHCLLIVSAVFLLSACGHSQFKKKEEAVKAAWTEVLNQYQQRADLIPDLVNTVKSYTKNENETLTQTAKARSAAVHFKITPEVIHNPETFKQFQKLQNELSASLLQLIVISQRYPDLKADERFRYLQVQIEETEKRITAARQRYIQAVADYNIFARQFPSNITALILGYKQKMS